MRMRLGCRHDISPFHGHPPSTLLSALPCSLVMLAQCLVRFRRTVKVLAMRVLKVLQNLMVQCWSTSQDLHWHRSHAETFAWNLAAAKVLHSVSRPHCQSCPCFQMIMCYWPSQNFFHLRSSQGLRIAPRFGLLALKPFPEAGHGHVGPKCKYVHVP